MKYIIVVDKQTRTNPSTEKKEIPIEIDELRKKGDKHDDLIIENSKAKVIRRIGITEYHVTYVLDKEIVENIGEIKIPLFEGDNYIYIKDQYNNQMCAEYIIKNDFTDMYVTNLQMSSAIEQTAQSIDLSVDKKLSGYSTTKQMNSAINMRADSIILSVNEKFENYDTSEETSSKITQKANEIINTVSSTYATKEQLTTAKSEIKQTTDSISSTVSKKVGNDEIISKINQSAEKILISGDKIDIDGKAVHFNTEINQTFGPYTQQDTDRIMKIVMGEIKPTSSDYAKYDIDDDGKISMGDNVRILTAIRTNNGYLNVKGTFTIDPYSSQKSVKIYRHNNVSGLDYPSAILSVLNNYFLEIDVGGPITFVTDEYDGIEAVMNSNGIWYRRKETSGNYYATFGTTFWEGEVCGDLSLWSVYGYADINTGPESGGEIMLGKAGGTQTIINGSEITIAGGQVQAVKNLYNNTSGTTGTVTLNESASNFTYLEIFFRDNYDVTNSVKIHSPNGKNAILSTVQVFNSDNVKMAITKAVSISGTSITTKTYGKHNSWNNSIETTNLIYITKVIGYK